jgi:ABC-type lipoprotein release transport system permease subunit
MKGLRLIFFWLKVAFLFLFRSLRSTGILSLMLFVAVAALIFLSALAVGVNDAMIRNSVSLYSGHITGYDFPKDVPKGSLSLPGVTAVLKRRSIPGNLVKGVKTFQVVVTEINPGEEFRVTAIGKKIVEGTYLSGLKREALLGKSLAKKLGIGPGDAVRFSPFVGMEATVLQVKGIYDTGIEQLDGEIVFCPLHSLRDNSVVPSPRVSPFDDGTKDIVWPNAGWSAAVFLKDDVAPDDIIASYRRIFPGSARFKSWETLMPDLKQLIELNYVSMSIVILLVFGVVSLGIACAFVIVILKSLREYGIVKAMGATSRETMLLIVFEVVLMNLFASSLGVVLGIALSLLARKTGIDLTAFTSHNRYFTVSGVVYPRLTPFAWGVPPALAFLFSLIAAIWPAVLVSRRRAAEILRIV